MLQRWELRHLNSKTMWSWLNQIPDFGNAINKTCFQIDRPAKRSNLVRVALLKHFGGVWIDYTIILV